MEPTLVSSSKPTFKSNRSLRDTSSGRPPGLDGFKLLASRDSTAYLVDNIAERRTHGYFHQTGVGYLTTREKILVPCGHALHMIVGLGIFLWLLTMAWKGRFTPEWYTPVEIGGLYWHFVDIIWIYLFPLLYLIDRHP